MNNKFILSLIVCVIAAGGLGFYGGTVYAKKNTVNQNGRIGMGGTPGMGFRGNGQAPAGGPGGRGGNGMLGNFSNGEIINKDTNSLTIKLMDGGSKIVLFSTSTRVGKMTEGTVADLTNGTNISVIGAMNADGSITASTIQIRPATGTPDLMLFRGRAPGQPPAQP